MSESFYAIGVDIGGTRTKLAIVSTSGEIVHHSLFLTTDYPKKDQYYQILEQHILSLIEWAQEHQVKLEGIGLGAPNAHREKGVMINPPNFPWSENLDLVTSLKSKTNLEVVLENDACIAGFGEAQWGEAQGLERFVVVTLGTGVGFCTFIDGQAVKSVDGLNGEFGHLCLYPHGRPCACGGVGHLEKYLSVSGMVQTINEMMGLELVFKDVLDQLQQPHPPEKLLKAIEFISDDLGRALSFIHLLLGPELFILAGGGSVLGQEFCTQVETALRKYTFGHFKNHPKVMLSQLTNELGAVAGAASLIFQKN